MTRDQVFGELLVAAKEILDHGCEEYDPEDVDCVGSCRYCGRLTHRGHAESCPFMALEKIIIKCREG